MGGLTAAQKRQKETVSRQDAEAAASAIAAAAGGAGASGSPAGALEAAQAKIAELEVQLAAAREAADAPGASEDAGAQAADVFADLAEAIRGLSAAQVAPAAHTFRPGESVEEIERSLVGSVGIGEHSGRRLATPVTFRSRGANQNVIRKGRARSVGPTGEAVVTRGVHYAFAPAMDGERGGVFTTDDEDVVEFLKARPGFGVEYWVVGEEPNDVPSAGPTLDRILEATIELDVEVLDSIEHEERKGWNRAAVLGAVAAARRRIERSQAEVGL
jgi:hypothetical protein